MQRKHELYGESRSTMHEIARLIGLAPSGHLTGILGEMVEDGDLLFEVVEHRPGWEKRVFRLADVHVPIDMYDEFEATSKTRLRRKQAVVSIADLSPRHHS
jgi:hypothetical protein